MKKNFLLLIFISAGFLAKSQTPLTLSQAIQTALEKNFQIRIAKDQTVIAKNNNKWGEAGRYPSIDLRVTQNNSILDQSNNPTAFIKDKIFSSSIAGDASLSWTLFNGFRIKYTKERLELLQAQSEGNGLVIVENTIHSVILGYYNAVLQKEKLDVLKKLIKLSKDKYDYYQSKKDFGTTSTFDLLQFKNAYLTDSTNFLLQDLNYRNAVRNLNLLLSVDVETRYELTDFLNPILENYNLDTLKNEMLRDNHNILNQFINLELQRTSTNIAKGAMYPTVAFQMGASNQLSYFQTSQFSSDGSNLNYYGNFTINFNLFNGGKTKRAIQNAKIQERIAETSLQEKVFTLTSQLVTAYELYLARIAILNLTNESYLSSEFNLKLAAERFEKGTISSFDYRNVQLQFLNSAMTRLEAANSLIVVHTDLMRITGGIVQIQE